MECRGQRETRALRASPGSQVWRDSRDWQRPLVALGSQEPTAATGPKDTPASEENQDHKAPLETWVFQDQKDFQENHHFTSLTSQASQETRGPEVCMDLWGPQEPGARWEQKELRDFRGQTVLLVCLGSEDPRVKKDALCLEPKEKRGSRGPRGPRGRLKWWSLQMITSLKEKRETRARKASVEDWVYRVWMDFLEKKARWESWGFLDSGVCRGFRDCPGGRGHGAYRGTRGSRV